GSLPFWVNFELSWRAALFVAGLSVLAALIAGLIPALQATGRVLPMALRALGSRTGVPLGATWTALIVAQVALALALLPSAVELAWGHLRPGVLGPGFAAHEFLTARLTVNSQHAQSEFVRQLEAEPGVSAVTIAASLAGAEPLVLIESEEAAGGARVRRYVRTNQVDPSFFEVFGLQAMAGRTFRRSDFSAGAIAVVDQTFARQVVGQENAVGRRVRPLAAPGSEPGPWYEIVGMVADLPANTSQGRLYLPIPLDAREAAAGFQVTLRGGSDPIAMSRRLQDIGSNLHPGLRLDDVRRLDEVLAETQLSSNLTSYALAIVTLSVLVLSAAGLYALMSFTVTLRRREIGIRTALGARPGRLLTSVFARALWQVAGGVAVGAAIALFLHGKLNIEVEGGWHIPGVLPAAAIFIMTIGLLSAAGPARRAARVDPTEALRDG
ncbi:MAG TPA: FtsX-like permease family protein, partial [Vicinamibacterales bacterium]|nr:FtsX-like permease family protein [Vicinamibacterales bacterium]